MVTALKTSFGEAKVTIDVEGCMNCGTIGSDMWMPIKSISFILNGKANTLQIYLCGDCFRKKGLLL